jgi:hypothetical protein
MKTMLWPVFAVELFANHVAWQRLFQRLFEQQTSDYINDSIKL